jgi:peptidoglycan/xylan/chitin deacetylase (PgdA/CDA1 family)
MTLPRVVKRSVAGVLASDAVSSIFRPLARGVASIFMLHRFADPDRGNAGHDARALRTHLEYLRRRRYELVSLTDLVERLRTSDSRLYKTVAFSIDDGYADYASVGAPVFAEFDCPTTVFIVTGVTDRRSWYWWDHLRVSIETSTKRSFAIDIGANPSRFEWSDAAGAARVARRIIDALKLVPDAERRRVLDTIPSMLDVEPPTTPPARYESMTWDQIRECGRGLTTFGAHTVSHPILARTNDALARFEIEESWRRLREQTEAAIGVFCYPNGGPGDATSREATILRDAGITAAVTSSPGYASATRWKAATSGPYFVPRFPYDGQLHELAQVVSGVERLKLAIRRPRS